MEGYTLSRFDLAYKIPTHLQTSVELGVYGIQTTHLVCTMRRSAVTVSIDRFNRTFIIGTGDFLCVDWLFQ